MEIIFLIGRILLGGFFLLKGINHFKNKDALAGYAKMKRLPSPIFSVLISGIVLFLSGLGIILGVYVNIALWMAAIFLVLVSFTMHKFWAESDDAKKMSEKSSFMNNMALAGAVMMLLLYVQASWPYVISLY